MFGELIPSLKAFLKKSFELQMYISFSHKTLDLYYKFDMTTRYEKTHNRCIFCKSDEEKYLKERNKNIWLY